MNYEVALINAIIENDDMPTAMDQGASSVFSEHKDVWEFMVQFYSDYKSVPSKEVVKSNFRHFEFINASSPLQYYIDDAKKQSLNRGVRGTLMRATEMLKGGEDPARVISLIQNESLQLIRESGRMHDANITDFEERLSLLKQKIENPNETYGVPSGIGVIDQIFGGFQPGDFIPVIGWTGAGKSWLTRLFAANAWRAGYRPLIISLEMDKIQEQYRMDTILNAGECFTNSQLTNGKSIDFDQYANWAKETFEGKHPIHLVTAEGISAPDEHFVQAKIDQYKPDLVILDGHALFEYSKGGNEVEKTKKLSTEFKRMAVSNRIPIIDVCMVTMEEGAHDDRPPLLSEIAWSRQLSYDADLVLAVHRSPEDPNTFTVVARKVRRNNLFAFYLDWDLNSGKWREKFD